jgi:hypothetical protein
MEVPLGGPGDSRADDDFLQASDLDGFEGKQFDLGTAVDNDAVFPLDDEADDVAVCTSGPLRPGLWCRVVPTWPSFFGFWFAPCLERSCGSADEEGLAEVFKQLVEADFDATGPRTVHH